jgi:phosphatidylserine decarboxylase
MLTFIDCAENFNQFFYRSVWMGTHIIFHFLTTILHSHRKLKPSARPVEQPDNSYRLVSAADCRFMAFETVNEATRLWIKGREFSVARLLGDAYKDQAERYNGGALCIFRLAPQDYHRFHSPVDGTIGPMTYISGEYYTVNVSILPLTHLCSFIDQKLAPSHSNCSGRIRRERPEDCAH